MSEENVSSVEAIQNVKELVHLEELNKDNVMGTEKPEKLTPKVGHSNAADEPMDYIEEEQIVFKDNSHEIPSVEDDLLDFDDIMDTDSSSDSPEKKSKLSDLCSDDSDSQSDDFVLNSANQVKSFDDCLNDGSNSSVHENFAVVISVEDKKVEEDRAAECSKTDTVPELEDGELNYEEDELFVNISPQLAGDVEVSEDKLKERAKRFGLNVSEIKISEDVLLTLYTSLGIPFHHVRSGKLTTVRLNTIHMYGVEDMTIADILNYFDRHSPQSVERINRSSCNVLFGSDLTAARAMLGNSFDEPVKSGRRVSVVDSDEKEVEREKASSRQSTHSENEECGDLSSEEAELSLSSLPPGVWRKGYLCPKSKLILLRFATIDDITVSSMEKKRKSIPYFKGGPGLISSSKKRKIMGQQKERKYYSSYNRQQQQRSFQTRTWSKPRRQSHDDSDEDEPWGESSSSSTFDYYRKYTPSYDKKFPHFERKVRGNSDENTVYAGNKPVYMSMYADSVEGHWQTVKPQPEQCSPYEEKKTVASSETSSHSSSSSVQPAPQNYPRRVVPSRFQVWNPIAKDMVKDSELAEELEYYRPRYQKSSRQDDLRSKLQVPSTSYQRPRRYENGGEGDLRTKLQNLRSGDSESRHRSPLMIKVSK